MPTPDKTEVLELMIKTLNEKLVSTEEHLKKTDASVKALEDQRNNFLIWGIIALGSGVVGMGTFIFNLILPGHGK